MRREGFVVENNLLLQAVGINKQFSGVPVLKNVDLDIRKGEVHALMGENGAGKSTMIKIITGVYTKDSGQIFIEGKPVEILSRQDARNCGISVIYQELSLIPALSVVDNIFLGQEIQRRGFLAKKEMRKKVKELIDKYEFDINPDGIVQSFGMAKRQLVEILKALSMEAKLIIMDEPTSALSAAESEKLFETIDGLRNKGASILYISHRLDEVYRLSDRLTVMRAGVNVGVMNKDEITPAKVMQMMIGREVKQIKDTSHKKIFEDNVLEVKGLAYKNILKDVNFKAYGGEILGIGGLVGSGRTELIRCIYGAEKQSKGTIPLHGKPVNKAIAKNIRNGFSLVPEDRRNEGFFPILSIEKNITIASYDKLAKFGVVSRRKEIEWTNKAIKDYDVRPPIRSMPVANLSGGTQQKVILGRWLNRDLNVLLLDEPTAGIDVGVKGELYQYLEELSKTGVIIIMVSSDLAELTYVADRILVMHDGKFFEEFTHENVTQTAVLLAASGVHTKEGKAL
jgi:ribose transport system ATP-binding protein